MADFEDEENWLGRSRYESLPFFKGEVHEFRIHNRALTEENVIASRAEGPDQLPGPEISLFKSLPTKIRSGGSSELAWKVLASETLEIIPGPIILNDTEGSVTVRPAETTTYTLRAFNSDGLKKAHSTVVVDDRPVIQDFASTKMRIQEGEEAVLYWLSLIHI